jgi:hypothetical protein
MNEQNFEQQLLEILSEESEMEISNAQTFENAGILTCNRGLVVCLASGAEFQVTIVQSRNER